MGDPGHSATVSYPCAGFTVRAHACRTVPTAAQELGACKSPRVYLEASSLAEASCDHHGMHAEKDTTFRVTLRSARHALCSTGIWEARRKHVPMLPICD